MTFVACHTPLPFHCHYPKNAQKKHSVRLRFVLTAAKQYSAVSSANSATPLCFPSLKDCHVITKNTKQLWFFDMMYVVKQCNVLTVCLSIYLWSIFAIYPWIYVSVYAPIYSWVHRQFTSLSLTSSFLFSVTSKMWHLMTLPPTLRRLCGAVALMWALALWLMLETEQASCKRDSSSSRGASQVECDKSPFTIGARGQG